MTNFAPHKTLKTIAYRAGGAEQPPALRAGSNRLLGVHNSHWRSLESGGLRYKSRQLKKGI